MLSLLLSLNCAVHSVEFVSKQKITDKGNVHNYDKAHIQMSASCTTRTLGTSEELLSMATLAMRKSWGDYVFFFSTKMTLFKETRDFILLSY